MTEEQRKKITEALDGFFELRKNFLDHELNSNILFSIAKLDLFKLLAGLIVAILGVGYFDNWEKYLDPTFSLISFISAIFTLIFSISYTREVIDLYHNDLKKDRQKIFEMTEKHINNTSRALIEDDYMIFVKYANEELEKDKIIKSSDIIIWTGEILVFLFYLTVASLFFAFLALRFNFELISYQSVVMLILVWLLSFRGWAINMAKILSYKVK